MKKLGTTHTFLVAVAAVLLMVGCGKAPTVTRLQGRALGTIYNITVVGELPEEFSVRLDSLLGEVNRSMSIFDKSSLLSRINRGEEQVADRHIIRCVEEALRVSALSEGAYDITIGPLVEAFGFAGDDPNFTIPTDSLLEFVGYQKIRLEGDRLVKADPRVRLDLNSIAKGYAVDLTAALIEEYGHENYLVDIGGEIVCRGTNPRGERWGIGVETPFEGNFSTTGEHITTIVRISGVGMATSGNYRNFHTDPEGNKFTHIIDPRTGNNTASSLLSATVIAPSCMTADAYGTMFIALGLERSREVAKREGIAALFIYDDGGTMRVEKSEAWELRVEN